MGRVRESTSRAWVPTCAMAPPVSAVAARVMVPTMEASLAFSILNLNNPCLGSVLFRIEARLRPVPGHFCTPVTACHAHDTRSSVTGLFSQVRILVRKIDQNVRPHAVSKGSVGKAVVCRDPPDRDPDPSGHSAPRGTIAFGTGAIGQVGCVPTFPARSCGGFAGTRAVGKSGERGDFRDGCLGLCFFRCLDPAFRKP